MVEGEVRHEVLSESRFSIIVPVHDSAGTLQECLGALVPQLTPRDEVVVVDDASGDDAVAVCARFGVRCLRNDRRRGAFGSRNRGASAARGRWLVFLDADAVPHRALLQRIESSLGGFEGGALVGIYASECGPRNLVSRFKNLWIRFSYLRAYLQGGSRIDWLFGCITVMPRVVFHRLGGFCEDFRVARGGGDVELGLRLGAAGVGIRLEPRLTMRHLKRFGLVSLMANDRRRSAGYVQFGLGRVGVSALLRRRRFANIERRFVVGVGIVVLAAVLGLAGILGLPFAGIGALVLVALHPWLYLRFYRYLRIHGGAGLAFVGAGLLLASQLACAVGLFQGVLRASLARPLRTRGTLRTNPGREP